MFKTIHIHLSVRGALHWTDEDWKDYIDIFSDQHGNPVTIDQAKDFLMDELSQGHEKIPVTPCSDFDYKTGCRGHQL